jgi:hypothetical protein
MQYHVVRDGQQLGKVSEADLKRGLGDGHYLATDLVWRDGMAEWKPLGEVLGLPAQPASSSAAGASPAPAGPARSSGPAASFAPAPRFGSRTALPEGVAPPNSGLAVTSLIAGIASILLCGLGGIGSLVAIICGHKATSRIDRSGGTEGGRGMAVAGLIMGYISLVLAVIFYMALFASLVMPVFAKIQDKGNVTLHTSYAVTLQAACMSHAINNDGKYPGSLEELAEKGLVKADFLQKANDFKVPGWEGEPGFEYRGGGKDHSAPPDTVILISNAADRNGQRVVARIDGSVKLEQPEH